MINRLLTTYFYKPPSRTQLTPSPNLFDEVPGELTIEIFKLLPANNLVGCRLVCREWKRLTKTNPFLHRKIEVAWAKSLFPDSRGLRQVALFEATYDIKSAKETARLIDIRETSLIDIGDRIDIRDRSDAIYTILNRIFELKDTVRYFGYRPQS